MVSAGLLALAVLPACGGLVTFNDRSSFEGAAPGLPVEDFEEALIDPGVVAGFPAPLDSTSSNFYFSPGDILAGIQFAASSAHDWYELALLGAGFAENPSKLIVANYFVDSFLITLNPGVGAIGFDVHSFMGGPQVQIAVYDTAGGLLGSYDIASSATGLFWGAISDGSDLIGSIVLTDTGGGAEGVDNVAFGLPGEAVIPEPATFVLSGFALLALAFVGRLRRS